MASFYGLAIDPFNPTNMYADLDTGVYKSTDSGVNWTFSNGSPANIYKALITDPVRHNTVYAGINTNTAIEAYLTTDAGATWTAINNNLPAVGIARFLVPTNNPSVLYAGTQSGVYVYGIPPLVGQITATPNPAQVNQAVTASANFTDIPANTHTASWNWGDTTVCGGNPDPCHGTVTESNGSGSVSNSHAYTAAGVYTITLTVTDNHGATGQSTYQYVVVYDPSAGWVSGDKEFTSPAGAVTGDTSATGKANFGFQAKYQNGSMVPSGKNVSLSFPAGNIAFTSTGYQWLVVNGSKATFKADGTLNGTAGYTILVSAIDQGSSQPSGLVRFQIKDSGGNVVYDTQQGAVDTADPTTSVTKGKITVH